MLLGDYLESGKAVVEKRNAILSGLRQAVLGNFALTFGREVVQEFSSLTRAYRVFDGDEAVTFEWDILHPEIGDFTLRIVLTRYPIPPNSAFTWFLIKRGQESQFTNPQEFSEDLARIAQAKYLSSDKPVGFRERQWEHRRNTK